MKLMRLLLCFGILAILSDKADAKMLKFDYLDQFGTLYRNMRFDSNPCDTISHKTSDPLYKKAITLGYSDYAPLTTINLLLQKQCKPDTAKLQHILFENDSRTFHLVQIINESKLFIYYSSKHGNLISYIAVQIPDSYKGGAAKGKPLWTGTLYKYVGTGNMTTGDGFTIAVPIFRGEEKENAEIYNKMYSEELIARICNAVGVNDREWLKETQQDYKALMGNYFNTKKCPKESYSIN